MLTRDLGYLVGHYFCGDGGAYDNTAAVRFTSAEVSHQEEMRLILQRVGWNFSPIRRYDDYGGFRVTIASVYNWFRAEFGFLSSKKKLPGWVMFAPREFREGVLDGLVSSDGWITLTAGRRRQGSGVGISMKHNPGLVQAVGLLTRTLGIMSSMAVPDDNGDCSFVCFAPTEAPWLHISHPRRRERFRQALRGDAATRGYLRGPDRGTKIFEPG